MKEEGRGGEGGGGGGGGEIKTTSMKQMTKSLSLFFTVSRTILRNRASFPAAYLIGVLKNDNSRLNRNWFIWKATTDTHTNRSPAQRMNSRNILLLFSKFIHKHCTKNIMYVQIVQLISVPASMADLSLI